MVFPATQHVLPTLFHYCRLHIRRHTPDTKLSMTALAKSQCSTSSAKANPIAARHATLQCACIDAKDGDIFSVAMPLIRWALLASASARSDTWHSTPMFPLTPLILLYRQEV
jgi:hypothetical protein